MTGKLLAELVQNKELRYQVLIIVWEDSIAPHPRASTCTSPAASPKERLHRRCRIMLAGERWNRLRSDRLAIGPWETLPQLISRLTNTINPETKHGASQVSLCAAPFSAPDMRYPDQSVRVPFHIVSNFIMDNNILSCDVLLRSH